jgi:hypothetical protein
MEKKGILAAFVVVFPIMLAILNFQFEGQMDQVVKTAAAEVAIVDDNDISDVWTKDFTIFHVRQEAIEKLAGYQARFIGYDHTRNMIRIEIYGDLATGSDTACETAVQLFHSLTDNIVDAELKVMGDFVPSARNPMDREWTQYLIQEISY